MSAASASDAGYLPPGIRIYAVGDIHGRLDLLDRLLARITADQETDPAPAPALVFLGDYVDRGTDSAGVLARLAGDPMPGAVAGMTCRFIKGNHDEMMLRFLAGQDDGWHWLTNGGGATLASYGVAASGPPEDMRHALAAALPAAHRGFLETLESHVRIGGYFLTHAGVRPGVALEDQSPDDLMWIRDAFLGSDADFGAVVVHGHTPMPAPVSRANRIGVDTGAWMSGTLTAAVLEGHKRRFLNT